MIGDTRVEAAAEYRRILTRRTGVFMSRMHDDLDVTLRVLKRVSTPAHTFRSWSQLARRERVSDDKLNRSLTRAADLAGGNLTELRDNRISPTPLGREFRDLVERLLALGKSLAEPVEVLRVAITPGANSEILASAVGEFSRAWGGVVSLQVSVAIEGIREAVEAGGVAFAMTGPGSEPVEPDERIDIRRPLCLLVPHGHRLSECDVIDADHFGPDDRVFVPLHAAHLVGEFLTRVPAVNRFEIGCPDTIRRLVTDKFGLGIEYARPNRRTSDGFTRVPVVGTEARPIGLVLPRNRERLTEPARYFLGVLRQEPDSTFLPVPTFELPAVPELPPIPEPIAS